MKILHICSTYNDRPLYRLLFNELSKLGVDNIIYVPRWTKQDVADNVYIVNKKFSKIGKLLYWGEQRYILKDIENRIDLKSIDLVHVHRVLYGGYVALKLKEKYNIPYVVAVRNSDLYGFGRNIRIFKSHFNRIVANAYRIVFLSKTYLEKTAKNYICETNAKSFNDKSEVIPNGINRFFLDNTIFPDTHSLPDGKNINIISVAEIDHNKNVKTLIKACQLLLFQGYNVKLNLYGRIVNNSVYKKAVSYEFVVYHGIKPKEELLLHLRGSDIFVMPSIHESFGLVYAEAMTQGVPVVYSRGQGFDGQYKEGEVGYSVDCFDAQEIADRMIDILNDYRNISNQCIENSKRYSWEKIAKRYKEIYDQSLLIT